MATRRTHVQIERDLARIKKASLTATSLWDISESTGLSSSQIVTSLKKHPIIWKRIKSQLFENKMAHINDVVGSSMCETFLEEGPTVEAQEQAIVSSPPPMRNVSLDAQTVAVIDTSICCIEDIVNLLALQKKVIVTSETIKELKKLQGRRMKIA